MPGLVVATTSPWHASPSLGRMLGRKGQPHGWSVTQTLTSGRGSRPETPIQTFLERGIQACWLVPPFRQGNCCSRSAFHGGCLTLGIGALLGSMFSGDGLNDWVGDTEEFRAALRSFKQPSRGTLLLTVSPRPSWLL